MIVKACTLAFKDYCHETLLSACAVLSLAAVLTPLLILYGVKYGIITTMTERLENNPHNLEVIPVSSGHYTQDFMQELKNNPHVGFVMPKTRSISATMSIALQGETSAFKRVNVSLEPTGKGDILLTPYKPQGQKQTVPVTAFSITLSARAAERIQAKEHMFLDGYVERTHKGKIQKAKIPLWVEAVLPLEVQQREVAFVPLILLEATENFRDGRMPQSDARLSQAQGFTGEEPPKDARIYPSFRLYAKNLDGVTALRTYFNSHNVDVYTKAEEISTVRTLNNSLNLIFGLIGTTAALGFLASTASHALASVRRKERYLGILCLVGYDKFSIMAFPLFQSLATALLGSALATMLYSFAAYLIDYLFQDSTQNSLEEICTIPFMHVAMGFGIVIILSLSATLLPAIRAAKIIPSKVIRDV